ncbi:MAG TPA: hypothetical protein VJ741_00215, partial [Solirubrobacteraceae bacterium]|nr:hypothetical protein [Solirubrobacteraceae bacterium]
GTRIQSVSTSDDLIRQHPEREHAARSVRAGRARATALTGGGTDGNEQLTTVTGAILIVLLAVIGFTIPQLRQFVSVHLFVGMLLIGPVLLKMASTGYRFLRYYTGNAAYRHKGPPEAVLRVIGPIVMLSTVAVFATGVVLLILGPSHRDPWVELHKLTFIVWVMFMSLHVLLHLPAVARALGIGRAGREQLAGAAPGAAGRWIAIAGALVAGLVLAIVLIPDFAAWTAHGVFVHHHHDG